MKYITSLSAAALLASSVHAAPTLSAPAYPAPTAPAVTITDVDILQYALTLEHLENVFYKEAISKFPLTVFLAAGYTETYYNNLKYIVHDEEEHVKFLSMALTAAGAKPVAACEYNFPYTDINGFITLSSVLEGVGTSAYIGGAGLITNKDYLSVAASILVTEALHTSLQRNAIGQISAANPYGTSLGLNAVYTLAAAFIKSCPETNVGLPVKAFPNLAVAQGLPAAPGIHLDLRVDGKLPEGFYVTFVSGLDTISVSPLTATDSTLTASIPASVSGQSYVFVTNGRTDGRITDSIVLFGPAIIEVTPPSPTFDAALL